MINKKIFEVKDLYKYFPVKRGIFRKTKGYIKAIDGISFIVNEGETFCLVGESGSGKTTVGRTILKLNKATEGEAIYEEANIFKIPKSQLRVLRPQMQIIFQDPFSSLSPRLPVSEIIGEAIKQHKIVPKDQIRGYIKKIMEDCGLQSHHIDRYPHEFSGGERQRIGIARALALKPKFVVCDEPTSALDVSIQAQIINLLKELQIKYKFSYLFITHNLSVAEYISDYIGVMYLGNIVELGNKDNIFKNPLHPYTELLISSIPNINFAKSKETKIIEEVIPDSLNHPKGCKFHPRCEKRMYVCRHIEPDEITLFDNHKISCHLFDDSILSMTQKYNDLAEKILITNEKSNVEEYILESEMKKKMLLDGDRKLNIKKAIKKHVLHRIKEDSKERIRSNFLYKNIKHVLNIANELEITDKVLEKNKRAINKENANISIYRIDSKKYIKAQNNILHIRKKVLKMERRHIYLVKEKNRFIYIIEENKEDIKMIKDLITKHKKQ